MSEITVGIGYGKQATIEADIFTRILNNKILDSEEIRKAWEYPYEYVAVAENGSDPDLSVWCCVRCTWDGSHKTRVQYRAYISWSNRSSGWI